MSTPLLTRHNAILVQYLPANAGVLIYFDRAQQTSEWLNTQILSMAGVGITLAVWSVIAVIAAAVVFTRRDFGARRAVIE
ncbi:hypothetical protein [Agromyces mediolanus]|uniref:hypothetical protein n=1 Tax=Agromyces mediolanus TaxID=41986 RepID=UPI001E60CE9B|nr:hypothetical protein [Agromyces mediolanus]MCD1569897.1 hypothetical protein [Agromyces mediolanus]